MTLGQEIALLRWKDIDRSLMAREKVSSETPAHYTRLDAEEAPEGVVRIPCLAGVWHSPAVAFDSIELLELETGPVSYTLDIAPGGVLEVSENIALAEQGKARVNHELSYVLKGAIVIFASNPAFYLG